MIKRSLGTANMEKEYILCGPRLPKDFANESIGQQLCNGLLKFQHLPALIDGISEKTVLFKDLLQTSCYLASALQIRGYSKNNVIGILSKNSTYYSYPILASLYLGCTVTTYNPENTSSELLYLTNISRPSVIFCSAAALNTLLTIQKQIKHYLYEIVVIDSSEDIQGVQSLDNYIGKHTSVTIDPNTFKLAKINPSEDVAFILYSSGTTGLPKGVQLTHKNISAFLARNRDPSYYLPRKAAQEATIILLPLFHSYGLSVLLINLILGYTSIVLNKYDHVSFLDAVQKYQISRLYIVPPLASALMLTPQFQNFDVSSVEHIVCGSAPLISDIFPRLKQRFTNLKHFHHTYGMTEGLTLTAHTINDNKPESCGKVVSNVCAKVVDQEGKSLEPGCIGELYFKGDAIMKGYVNDPISTKLVRNENGWLSTGDIGYYDKDGYVYIVDRIKELIKYKGYQVSPAQLEALLLTHPNISDAAVIGLPHESDGELPCAIIVRKKECALTNEEVQNFIAAKTSPEKWLRGGVVFVSEIPKSSSGKISHKQLKDRYKLQSKI